MVSEEQRSGFFGDQEKWSEHAYRLFYSLKLLVQCSYIQMYKIPVLEHHKNIYFSKLNAGYYGDLGGFL